MQYRGFTINTRPDGNGGELETGTFDCEADLPHFGWQPYTVSPDDIAPANLALLDAFLRDGLIKEWRDADQSGN